MIYPVKNSKQSAWKIVYTRYEGFEKHAIDFLSREAGKYLIREEGIYKIHVLPCEKEGVSIKDNAIVIGCFEESKTVQKYIKEEELDGKDYLVKILINPNNPDARIVIITAKDPKNVFYGAIAFTDNYPLDCAPLHGGLKIPQWIYDYEMPTFELAQRAKIQTRSVFTWGQPINDYREYIRNLARLKHNQVIIWNDYMPINAKEIVDYAHSYGLEVIWGYSWGWKENRKKLGQLTEEFLRTLQANVLREYEENYKQTGCDGIYFQSFTEMQEAYIGEKLVAEVVTDFVNETVAEFFKRYPTMKIQFGLHATSVKNHLEQLARVDKRVEIVWEDCGTFPFDYEPIIRTEREYEETLALTRKIIQLRKDAPLGLVIKGFMTLDWEMFVHQSGPFVLGENHADIKNHDRKMRQPIWQMFESGWIAHGNYALRLIREAYQLTNGNVNICMAGVFDGEISLPHALCAEMAFDPEQEFPALLQKVSARQAVIRERE